MKAITILLLSVVFIKDLNAQKVKETGLKYDKTQVWQTNLDSMYVTTKSGIKKIQFIDDAKTGIKLVQAIIYPNGFVSAIIDYKDSKGRFIGTRYAMKAKRAGGENFITNKVFTDKKVLMKQLYESPVIPFTLAGKLKMLGELDGIKSVIDGIKNMKNISTFLNAKLPSGSSLEALRNKIGGGRKGGYSSGVPWGIFNNGGNAKDSAGGGNRVRHEGVAENTDGSTTFNDSHNSDDRSVIYGTSTTMHPNGRTETITTMIDDGGPNGTMRIAVTNTSTTRNPDGSPDDCSSRVGTTDVVTGRRTESTVTTVNGSNVGVETTSEYDGSGNVVSSTTQKVNVEYDANGISCSGPTCNPSETSGHLSPAEEERFWQSMPWFADLLYVMWAKEYTASLKRGNITRPKTRDTEGIPVNNRDRSTYQFNRVVVINCNETNGCIPTGKATTDPRQTWSNFVNPPRPH